MHSSMGVCIAPPLSIQRRNKRNFTASPFSNIPTAVPVFLYKKCCAVALCRQDILAHVHCKKPVLVFSIFYRSKLYHICNELEVLHTNTINQSKTKHWTLWCLVVKPEARKNGVGALLNQFN